jgi:hypothetical protein
MGYRCCLWLQHLSSQGLYLNLPNLPTLVFALLAERVAVLRHGPRDQGGAECLPIALW